MARGLVVMLVLLCASPAAAQSHAIGPGQEARVLELFAPFSLGAEVSSGFSLYGVAIVRDHVAVVLRDGSGRELQLTLRHVETALPGAERTTSFALAWAGESSSEARAARQALSEAIARNDHGDFWQVGSSTAGTLRGAPSVFGPRWGPTDWVPIDGLVFVVLLATLSVLLSVRLLSSEPRWMAGALVAITAGGAVVRLALSPQSFLGAWPWSRLYPHARSVADSPLLAAINDALGIELYLTDVMSGTTLGYAMAMPVVLFAHATYLLRDPRAGLVASFLIAFLPQHIRFSWAEDGFVGSLVLTSLAFALIHGWLRDPVPWVRWLLFACLPWVLYTGYLLRPLNILFIVVYLAALTLLHGETAPRWRRAAGIGVVLCLGLLASMTFSRAHDSAAGTALGDLSWIARAGEILSSPRLLVLTDPTKTPLVVVALAIVGAVLLWREGQRRLTLYLLGWWLTFLVAHAFVVQESMQPRYMLHLVVPTLLLASVAAVRLADRWAGTRNMGWLGAAATWVLVSPLLHSAFIGDLGYVEIAELDLVRRARAEVPAGCTIIEPTGTEDGSELRFARIGARAPTGRASRYNVIGILPDGRTTRSELALDDLLREPPECLYLYEGLACTTFRDEAESYSGRCLALRQRLRGERVLETRAPARFYDGVNVGPAPVRDPIPFRLSRARLE